MGLPQWINDARQNRPVALSSCYTHGPELKACRVWAIDTVTDRGLQRGAVRLAGINACGCATSVEASVRRCVGTSAWVIDRRTNGSFPLSKRPSHRDAIALG